MIVCRVPVYKRSELFAHQLVSNELYTKAFQKTSATAKQVPLAPKAVVHGSSNDHAELSFNINHNYVCPYDLVDRQSTEIKGEKITL